MTTATAFRRLIHRGGKLGGVCRQGSPARLILEKTENCNNNETAQREGDGMAYEMSRAIKCYGGSKRALWVQTRGFDGRGQRTIGVLRCLRWKRVAALRNMQACDLSD